MNPRTKKNRYELDRLDLKVEVVIREMLHDRRNIDAEPLLPWIKSCFPDPHLQEEIRNLLLNYDILENEDCCTKWFMNLGFGHNMPIAEACSDNPEDLAIGTIVMVSELGKELIIRLTQEDLLKTIMQEGIL